MNLDYAKRWAQLRGTDTEAFADLYAGDLEFALEYTMIDDHMKDTVYSRELILEKLGGFANDDPSNGIGVHTFTANEYVGHERWGLIVWTYEVEGLSTFRGIPAEGRQLKTDGSTFLRFNADGKIILDSTIMNDCPIFEALGLPIARPHYWDENFDPASLMA